MIAMCVVMPFMYNKNLKIALVHCEICAVINLKDLEKLIKYFKIK